MDAQTNTENMAKVMCKNFGGCNACMYLTSCDVKSFALRLNEAQYTTKAEAVSEFAEKLKAIIDNNDNFDRGVFGWRSDEINVLINLAVKQLYPTTTVEHI